MSPLNEYRAHMNHYYDNEPVRIVVSTQFLLKMGLAGFLIWAGWHFRNAECNHNLAMWLWVNGVGWLAFLTIFALSVMSSSGASDAATFTLAACFPCFLCAMCTAGPFLVIWFILGNIWVFVGGGVSASSHAAPTHAPAHGLQSAMLTRPCPAHDCAATQSSCDSGLYRVAFWYLIAIYIWAVVSCCCAVSARSPHRSRWS